MSSYPELQNIPELLERFSLHVFPFNAGEGTGLWWQHIPCLLAGLPWPAWIFAQLSVKWLPNTGVCKEPVGAGDYQCKTPSPALLFRRILWRLHVTREQKKKKKIPCWPEDILSKVCQKKRRSNCNICTVCMTTEITKRRRVMEAFA